MLYLDAYSLITVSYFPKFNLQLFPKTLAYIMLNFLHEYTEWILTIRAYLFICHCQCLSMYFMLFFTGDDDVSTCTNACHPHVKGN